MVAAILSEICVAMPTRIAIIASHAVQLLDQACASYLVQIARLCCGPRVVGR